MTEPATVRLDLLILAARRAYESVRYAPAVAAGVLTAFSVDVGTRPDRALDLIINFLQQDERDREARDIAMTAAVRDFDALRETLGL